MAPSLRPSERCRPSDTCTQALLRWWARRLTSCHGYTSCRKLESNLLTGTIPASLGNLLSLEYLYLRNNQLNGTIPVALGNLTKLQYFVADHNQLTGSLPASLGDLARLLVLYVPRSQGQRACCSS